MALTEKDKEILEFEASWWTMASPKAQAIRVRLGMAPAAYYRRLTILVDDEDAKAHLPMVVHRLRRRRTERRKERFEGIAEPHHPRS